MRRQRGEACHSSHPLGEPERLPEPSNPNDPLLQREGEPLEPVVPQAGPGCVSTLALPRIASPVSPAVSLAVSGGERVEKTPRPLAIDSTALSLASHQHRRQRRLNGASSGRGSPRSKQLALQREVREGTVPGRGGLGSGGSGSEEVTGARHSDGGRRGWSGGDGIGPRVCGLEPGWIVRPKDGIRGGDRHGCPLHHEVQTYYIAVLGVGASSFGVGSKAESPRLPASGQPRGWGAGCDGR